VSFRSIWVVFVRTVVRLFCSCVFDETEYESTGILSIHTSTRVLASTCMYWYIVSYYFYQLVLARVLSTLEYAY